MQSECTYYPSVLEHEALKAIYHNALNCPAWTFSLATFFEDDETPNPVIDLLQRQPDELQESMEYLENATKQVVYDFCGREFTEVAHNSFQISYEGHHGRVHNDGSVPNYVTCMFFLSPEWDSTWGGEFKVQTSNGEWGSVPYIPGSGVCFDGSLLHTGVGANTNAKKARLTYVTHGVTG